MCQSPPGGIMPWCRPSREERELARRNFYVGGKEHGIARRFLEAHGKGDLDAIEQMMTPDFVDHSLAPSQEPDREGYKRQVAEMPPPSPTSHHHRRPGSRRQTKWLPASP